MNTIDIIKAIKVQCKCTFTAMAQHLGQSKQQFGAKLSNETLRVDELIEILKLNNIFIRLQTIDPETGELYDIAVQDPNTNALNIIRKVAKRPPFHVRKQFALKRYDNRFATLLASSRYPDGQTEFGNQEMVADLYVDHDGDYFVVEYFKDHPRFPEIKVLNRNRLFKADIDAGIKSNISMTQEEAIDIFNKRLWDKYIEARENNLTAEREKHGLSYSPIGPGKPRKIDSKI